MQVTKTYFGPSLLCDADVYKLIYMKYVSVFRKNIF